MSTGEESFSGESLQARAWLIGITDDDTGRGRMDLAKLTARQRDASDGLFAAAMFGYLDWLSLKFGDVQRALEGCRSAHRTAVAAKIGVCHARTPGILADLYVGFDTFMAFATEIGAITASQADEYKARALSALIAGAAEQTHSQASQEPAHRFIELVVAAISAGRAWLGPLTTPKGQIEDRWPWGIAGTGLKIGWVDGDNVYLDPDTSFKAAKDMACDGSGITISPETLRRRLKDQGLLASTGMDAGRETVLVRKVADGKRRNVLHFLASTFGVSDDTVEKSNDKY
jgi:hypothetical protein